MGLHGKFELGLGNHARHVNLPPPPSTFRTTTNPEPGMKSLKALVANGILFLAGVMSLPTTLSTPRSLVIWHGLGDVYNAQGIQDFMDEIKEIHPGIFIHSIYVDTDPEADKKAGFVGPTSHMHHPRQLNTFVLSSVRPFGSATGSRS